MSPERRALADLSRYARKTLDRSTLFEQYVAQPGGSLAAVRLSRKLARLDAQIARLAAAIARRAAIAYQQALPLP